MHVATNNAVNGLHNIAPKFSKVGTGVVDVVDSFTLLEYVGVEVLA